MYAWWPSQIDREMVGAVLGVVSDPQDQAKDEAGKVGTTLSSKLIPPSLQTSHTSNSWGAGVNPLDIGDRRPSSSSEFTPLCKLART